MRAKRHVKRKVSKKAGRNPAKLPKGLQEFYATLSDVQFSQELMMRLTDLPDKAIPIKVAQHMEAVRAAEHAETFARDCRIRAAEIAELAFLSAADKFTVSQLQTATGCTND